MSSRLHRLAIVLLLPALLAACAGVPTRPLAEAAPAPAASGTIGWWYVNFNLRWPKDKEPSWYLDLMLADQVVRPALAHYRNQIVYWRVHRRAARDRAGDVFAFIFYAHPTVAGAVFQQIAGNPVLARMRSDGEVLKVRYDDPAHITRPKVEDTSDRNWPPAIQRSWPSYIMGVSQTWLDLISQLESKDPPHGDLYAYYRRLNGRMDEMWRDWGAHAYIHHLSGVFGYQELWVIRRSLEQF